MPSTIALDLGDGADDVEVHVVGAACRDSRTVGPTRKQVSVTGTLGIGADRFAVTRSVAASIGPTGGLTFGACAPGSEPDGPRIEAVSIDVQEGADRMTGAPDGESAPRSTTWTGGTGADTFVPGAGAEVMIGGQNRDTVSYLAVTTPIFVSVGNTGFGDGPDGDDVRGDVEFVIGGQADDQIRGDDSAEQLLGGSGADEYLAGGGDLIVDSDGAADRVDCGPGTDTAQLDLKDVVVPSGIIPVSGGRPGLIGVRAIPSCENVTLAAIDDGPPARIGRVALARRSVRARLTCPRAARVRCRGVLSVSDPRRIGRRLASRRYSGPRGAGRTVTVPATEAVVRRLRARGGLVVSTVERGVSRRGPRGAQRIVVLR